MRLAILLTGSARGKALGRVAMATILVADDSSVVRSFVKIYLEPDGYRFVEAEDGVRALHLVRLMSLDLAVVDVNMPRMNGLEFLESIGALRGRSMPVVMLTGEKGVDLEEHALKLGAKAFLRKPVCSAGLVETVRRLAPLSNRA